MKILFIADRPDCYIHGLWLHRIHMPSIALEKRGHGIKVASIGGTFSEELLEWPDTVVFGRIYPTDFDPVKWMKEFKKRGKRVIYDMDDDFWEVKKNNPSRLVSSALKDQYEGMTKEADAIITPSTVLAKKFKKYFKKKVFLCPNMIDPEMYPERPHTDKLLTIGYMGANSHFKDLQIVGDVLNDLSKKYDFMFTIYGLFGEPMEAVVYYTHKALQMNFKPEKRLEFQEILDFHKQLNGMKVQHVPFMPPELHPHILSHCDFDIAIAPLEDDTFNNGKSSLKFYEYAGVGSATLTSDVLPYSEDADYRAKNTKKDWYKKLEKLIVDKDFRETLAKKQRKWVLENRSTDVCGLPWELACQREGIKGLTSAMQR